MSVVDWMNSTAAGVAAYGVAALACVVALRQERGHAGPRGAWPEFWAGTAIVLLLMTLGRALDVGRWVTGVGRRLAWSGNWYDSRRQYQALAVLAILAVGALGGASALRRLARRRPRHVVPVCAVSALVVLALVRFVSLHWIDRALARAPLGGLRLSTVGELGLAAVVVISAALPTSPGAADATEPVNVQADGGDSVANHETH